MNRCFAHLLRDNTAQMQHTDRTTTARSSKPQPPLTHPQNTDPQTDIEDAVYIWSAEGATTPAPPAGPSTGQTSALTGGPFVLDSLLPLDDTASALAWLDSAGLPPMLAVGYASGDLELYARDRR